MSRIGIPTPDPFSGTPMLGRQPTPFSSGMFNIGGGGGGQMLQMVMTMLMQQMTQRYGMMPAQFMPGQSMLDQMTAARRLTGQMQTQQWAARADEPNLNEILLGLGRAVRGTAATPAQRQQTLGVAQGMSQHLPILAQLFGPSSVEWLYGRRGSAAFMANQMYRTGFTSRDPVTGQREWSSATTGTISSEVFARLYGTPDDVAQMKGLQAGAAGALYHELHTRGRAGRPFGAMSALQRYKTVTEQPLDDAQVARMAEHMESIRAIRARGDEPTDKDYATARQDLRGTYAKFRESLQAPGGDVDLSALADLPGADVLLRSHEADRISNRLRDMAGVVSAMRDIFGGMGRPNAPMAELINGLQALTQQGLTHMTPAQLEQTIRSVKEVARQTGMGVPALMGLTSGLAGTTDRLGIHRTFAVQAGLYGGLFAAVHQQTQPEGAKWGGMTSPEEAALQGGQLFAQAAGSALANQHGATLRLAQLGQLAPGSEAEALNLALTEGQATYQWGGQTKSVHLSRSAWTDVMKRGGVTTFAGRTALRDRSQNQRALADNPAVVGLTRLAQARDVQRQLQGSAELVLNAALRDQGLDDVLTQRGFGARAQTRLQRAAAAEITQAAMDMSTETRQDPLARQAYMAKAFEASMIKQVRQQGKAAGKSDAEIERDVNAVLAQLGPADARGVRRGSATTSTMLSSSFEARIQEDEKLRGYGTMQGVGEAVGFAQLHVARAREREMQTVVAMETALAGLAHTTPGARIIESLRAAKPGDDPIKQGLRALGAVDLEEIAKQHAPTRALLDSLERFENAERYAGTDEEIAKRFAKRSKEDWDQLPGHRRDAYLEQARAMRGAVTDKGWATRHREAELAAALNQGGVKAEAWLAKEAKAVGVEDPTTIETAIDARIRAVEAAAGLTPAARERKLKQLRDRKKTVEDVRAAQQENVVTRITQDEMIKKAEADTGFDQREGPDITIEDMKRREAREKRAAVTAKEEAAKPKGIEGAAIALTKAVTEFGTQVTRMGDTQDKKQKMTITGAVRIEGDTLIFREGTELCSTETGAAGLPA